MASAAKWPPRLAPPVHPMETTIRTRAQSILTEAGSPGPLLPYGQALDVVRWHDSQPARPRRGILAKLRGMVR